MLSKREQIAQLIHQGNENFENGDYDTAYDKYYEARELVAANQNLNLSDSYKNKLEKLAGQAYLLGLAKWGDPQAKLAEFFDDLFKNQAFVKRAEFINGTKGAYGSSAMTLAAYHGHLSLLNFLINQKADVNVQTDYGDTPLHFAARTNAVAVIKILIEAKADHQQINHDGNTALEDADIHPDNNAEAIQLLESLESDTQLSEPAVSLPSLPNKTAKEWYFLAKNAFDRNNYLEVIDLTGKATETWTAEQFPAVTVLQSDDFEKRQAWMIDNFFTIVAAGGEEECALLVQINILRLHAHIKLQPDFLEEQTVKHKPLLVYREKNETKLVNDTNENRKRLLNDYINRDLRPLIELMISRIDNPVIKRLMQDQIKKIKNFNDFWKSIKRHDFNTIKTCLSEEPNLLHEKHASLFPLLYAVKEGFIEGVNYFLQQGANIDAQDRTGNAALHYAIFLRNRHIIKLLIKHKANVFNSNILGVTAFGLAAACEDFITVKYMLMVLAGVSEKIDDNSFMLSSLKRNEIVALIKHENLSNAAIEAKAKKLFNNNDSLSIESFKLNHSIAPRKTKKLVIAETKKAPHAVSKEISWLWEESYYEADEHTMAGVPNFAKAIELYSLALQQWNSFTPTTLEKFKSQAPQKKLAKNNQEYFKKHVWLLNILNKLEQVYRFVGDYPKALMYAEQANAWYAVWESLALSMQSVRQPTAIAAIQLLIAVDAGDLARVKELANDKRLLTITGIRDSSIYIAALTGKSQAHKDILFYLFDLNAVGLTMTDYQGKSLLHFAAELNYIDIIGYFTRKPDSSQFINLYVKDKQGRYPIDYTVHEDVIELLRDNLNHSNKSESKSTPLKTKLIALGREELIAQIKQCLKEFKQPLSVSNFNNLLAKSQLTAERMAKYLKSNSLERAGRIFLVRLYIKMHFYAEAKCEILLQLEHHPHDQESRVLLGKILTKQGKRSEAQVAFDAVYEKANNSDILQSLIYFYKAGNDTKKLQSVCERLLAIEPLNKYGLLGKAKVLEKNTKKLAESAYLALLQQHGEDPEILNSVAWFYIKTGAFTKAEKLYNHPSFVYPNVKKLRGLAKISEFRHHFEEAKKYYQELTEHFPQQVSALLSYALFCKKNAVEDAIEILTNIIKLHPCFEKAYIELIRCYCYQNNLNALLIHQKAVVLFPDSANLALIDGYIESNQLAEALKKCQSYLEKIEGGRAIPFHMALIKIYLASENKKLAMTAAQLFEKRFPQENKHWQTIKRLLANANISLSVKKINPSTQSKTQVLSEEKINDAKNEAVAATVVRETQEKSNVLPVRVFPQFIPTGAKLIMQTIEGAGGVAIMLGGTFVKAYYGMANNHQRDIDLAHSLSVKELQQLIKDFPQVFKHIQRCRYEGREQLFQYKDADTKIDLWSNTIIATQLIQDAYQRNFTINTVSQQLNGKLNDPTGWGMHDLECKILRIVTNDLTPENLNVILSPEETIQRKLKIAERLIEDPLRILQAMYLQAIYGLTIEPMSQEVIINNINLLKNVNLDKLNATYRKHFTSGSAEAYVNNLIQYGILESLSSNPGEWRWVMSQMKLFDNYLTTIRHNQFDPWQEVKHVYFILITQMLTQHRWNLSYKNVAYAIERLRFTFYHKDSKLFSHLKFLLDFKAKNDAIHSSVTTAPAASFFQVPQPVPMVNVSACVPVSVFSQQGV